MKEAEQDAVLAHESETVQVTCTEPPQKSGPDEGALFVTKAWQPPEKVASTEATHAANAASTSA